MGDKLLKALENITKKHGAGSAISGNEKIAYERIPTGSLGLDIITGGGYPEGRFVEFYAPESSGKSTCAIHGMVEAQKKYPHKKVAIIDAEHAMDMEYAKNLGLNADNVIFVQPDSGDTGLDIAEELIGSGEISFVLIDSIAALTPQAEIDGDMGESKMGLHARLISQACRKLTAKSGKTGTVVYWTNQLRLKLGVIFGCLHADTLVLFENGDSLPIRQVVENRVEGRVWSYNEKNNKFELKEITDWHFNGNVEKNEDYIHFQTKSINGFGRFGITVTPDHEVLTNNGWKKAKDIDIISDKLISKYESILNGRNKHFMRGVLVGDSTIRSIREGENHAVISLQDSSNNEYLKWKVRNMNYDFYQKKEVYYTKPHYELKKIKDKIGKRDPILVFDDGIIDDLSLAIWIMDDGHLKKTHGNYILSVKRFKKDIDKMQKIVELFEKNGLKTKYGKDGSIIFTVAESQKVADRIKKYVPDCMKYKLPDGFENEGDSLDLTSEFITTVEKEEVTIVMKRIASDRQMRQKGKYDITVKDNHNYVVGGCKNGVVVHNSPETTPGGEAMKFYASIRIDLRKKQGDKDKEDNVLNSKVTAKTVKNKTAPPFQKCEFDIVFGEGIDRVSEIVYWGEKSGVMHKTHHYYNYGDIKLANGAPATKALLKDNPELCEEIESKIREHYKI